MAYSRVLFLAFADKLLTMDPKEITYSMVNKKLQKIVLLRVKNCTRQFEMSHKHISMQLNICYSAGQAPDDGPQGDHI